MYAIDDLLLGVLASAIVAYLDRLDTKLSKKQKAALAGLKAKVQRLRTPDEQASVLLAEALRDQGQPDTPVAKVARVVGADVAWPVELTQWLLEPDPDEFAKHEDSVATRLAEAAACETQAVGEFLQRLNARMNSHLGLSQLRADSKLNLILTQLRELADLRTLVEQSHVRIMLLIQGLLSAEQRAVLKPVCPRPRAWSEGNSLLKGERPKDEDIDEDIDFERIKFKEVAAAIGAVDKTPVAFLFFADPQKGKTTFLKRVGWHLVQQGYPVFQLAEGARSEPYARWVTQCAAHCRDRPMVVLIDDPAR